MKKTHWYVVGVAGLFGISLALSLHSRYQGRIAAAMSQARELSNATVIIRQLTVTDNAVNLVGATEDRPNAQQLTWQLNASTAPAEYALMQTEAKAGSKAIGVGLPTVMSETPRPEFDPTTPEAYMYFVPPR